VISSRLRLTPVILGVLCLVPLACASKNSGGSGSTSSDLATAGADGQDTESNLESMGQSFVGSSSGGLAVQSAELLSPRGGELTPAGNWTNPAGGFYHPAGCLTASSDDATKTVTYVFNDCTGPLGLVHLTGTVTVVWSSSGATNLQLVYSAQGFKINQATINNWNATAVITANGNDRDMTWTASLAGVTGSGRNFNRTNNKDLKWTVGQPCLAISGSSDGTLTGKHLVTTITNYQRCVDSCPAANSEINVKDVDNGESVDIKFLGGAKAQFTAVDGTVTDIPLLCGI
jgi:hypothetical protein